MIDKFDILSIYLGLVSENLQNVIFPIDKKINFVISILTLQYKVHRIINIFD